MGKKVRASMYDKRDISAHTLRVSQKPAALRGGHNVMRATFQRTRSDDAFAKQMELEVSPASFFRGLRATIPRRA